MLPPSYVARADRSVVPAMQRGLRWRLRVTSLAALLALGVAVSVLVGMPGAAWLRWLIAGMALLVAVVTAVLARLLRRIRRRIADMAETEIEIDFRGIRQTRPFRQSVSWVDTHQVVVTEDDHWLAVHTVTQRNALRVPLTCLAEPPEEVIDAVRRYSDGRFPAP